VSEQGNKQPVQEELSRLPPDRAYLHVSSRLRGGLSDAPIVQQYASFIQSSDEICYTYAARSMRRAILNTVFALRAGPTAGPRA
jgi:hypothetical protein